MSSIKSNLNVVNIVQENFLNDTNVGQLHDKTLVLSFEATIDRNRVWWVLGANQPDNDTVKPRLGQLIFCLDFNIIID